LDGSCGTIKERKRKEEKVIRWHGREINMIIHEGGSNEYPKCG